MTRPTLEVLVERGSRSGRMVYVRRPGGSAPLLVQRRRVTFTEPGHGTFQPTEREQSFRGWA